jgi:DNA repair protein RadC
MEPLIPHVAEITLSYKNTVEPSARHRIISPSEAYTLVLSGWDMNRIELIEQFKVIFLNGSNQVLACYEVSSGGRTGTVADPRLIFAAALQVGAIGIILVHNHPSGNLQPSTSDCLLTEKLVAAGKVLDIAVRDHLIVTPAGFFSFSDEGIL